jgi:DNA polymerase
MPSTARQTPGFAGTSAADFLPARLTLPAMKKAVQGCRGCDLCCQGATQAVFGEGPAGARCILVGEQPGDAEDRAGKPFVGPSGRLMDELLKEAGVNRREVYVTNAVKHFRFEERGKRRIHSKPLARHINACLPWLEAEARVIGPKMMVALGGTAAQAIMGRDFKVTKQRGKVLACPYAPWFLATVHPSSILRVPDSEGRREAREMFVRDMRVVAERLEAIG